MKRLFLIVLFLVAMAFMVTSSMAQDAPVSSGAKTGKCDNNVTIETGAFTQYLEIETAEVYHTKPVVQTDITYERCGNKRTSYGVEVWTSFSATVKNPSGATEADVLVFANTKLTDKVSLYVDGGVFFYPEGFKIYKANATVSRGLKFSESVEGTLANSLSVYKTSDGSKGGITNRVSLDIAKSFGGNKGALTISPSFNIDNNPFSTGNGRVVGLGRIYGRYDIPISKKVDFFVMGGVSAPMFGDTDRKFRKVAGVGLVFHF